MRKLLLVAVLASAFLPAAALAQNQDGQGGNNDNQGNLNPIRSISATEMGEIGVAAATVLGAVAYFGTRRRTSPSKK